MESARILSFCQRCGKSLLAGARFCDGRGVQVASPPVTEPHVAEEILGVIENALTWNYKYNLLLTPSRIVVVKIRGPSDDLSYLFGGVVAGIVADKLLKPEEKRRERLVSPALCCFEYARLS